MVASILLSTPHGLRSQIAQPERVLLQRKPLGSARRGCTLDRADLLQATGDERQIGAAVGHGAHERVAEFAAGVKSDCEITRLELEASRGSRRLTRELGRHPAPHGCLRARGWRRAPLAPGSRSSPSVAKPKCCADRRVKCPLPRSDVHDPTRGTGERRECAEQRRQLLLLAPSNAAKICACRLSA